MDSKNSKIPLAQIGTKHGHAQGVLEVMIENNDVDVKGVFEPDKNRVEKLKKLNEYPWNKVVFFELPREFSYVLDVEKISEWFCLFVKNVYIYLYM